jgi:transaldolase
MLARFVDAGIDVDAVATQLLMEGTASFSKSWQDLMTCIATKSTLLKAA